MRQFRKYGSVRGASGNRLLYRDLRIQAGRTDQGFWGSGVSLSVATWWVLFELERRCGILSRRICTVTEPFNP
jgi:hypothetical protein